MKYESKNQPPIPRASFARRLVMHLAMATCLLLMSLGAGMVGYVYFVNLSWMDAFLNSSMLLSGMGPMNPIPTDGGKLFAGLYALYSGLVFIVTAALIFTPIVHRIIHHFHWNEKL